MTTAGARLAELERDFSADGSTMHLEEYTEKRVALLQEAQAESAAAAPAVSESRLMLMFKRFALNAASVHLKSEGALMTRIAALELRLKELEARGAGVNITAADLTIDGMAGVAAAVKKLDVTLRSPVVPVYGADGVLRGARRVETLDAGEAQ